MILLLFLAALSIATQDLHPAVVVKAKWPLERLESWQLYSTVFGPVWLYVPSIHCLNRFLSKPSDGSSALSRDSFTPLSSDQFDSVHLQSIAWTVFCRSQVTARVSCVVTILFRRLQHGPISTGPWSSALFDSVYLQSIACNVFCFFSDLILSTQKGSNERLFILTRTHSMQTVRKDEKWKKKTYLVLMPTIFQAPNKL